MDDEFIESYSDDLIYLDQFETILETQRVTFLPAETFFRPMLARLYAVTMIGGFEHFLCECATSQSHAAPLRVYFAKRENAVRVQALHDAFSERGLSPDPEILKDYLAIKYLRNTVVHSRWRDNEKQFVTERGFPSNIMKLGKNDLVRMRQVNGKMLLYTGLASSVPGSEARDRQ